MLMELVGYFFEPVAGKDKGKHCGCWKGTWALQQVVCPSGGPRCGPLFEVRRLVETSTHRTTWARPGAWS